MVEITQKIKSLVNKGYTQGAFRNKTNALKFQNEWKKKGYKTGYIRSSGAVVEGGYKRNAYYVIAEKLKKKNSLPLQKLKSKLRVKKIKSFKNGDWIKKETRVFG